jgi:glutamyl-tRNA reductase
MSIYAIGLNHKSASVDLREKLALDNDRRVDFLQQLKTRYPGAEFALLSTCNRVELYLSQDADLDPGPNAILSFLAGYHDVRVDQFTDAFYIYEDADAVKHLLTVTASLDSMVVGESQIVSQVKACYYAACEANTTGKVLNRLFHLAFSAGKEVYTSTTITRGRVSVASVAVDLARQLFSDFQNAKVLVIGAGEVGELLITHFQELNANHITLINRSPERARILTQKYGIPALGWEQLQQQMTDSDIVIAAAATDQPLFDKPFCQKVMARRRKDALLIVDIAVPRNFTAEVNALEDVYLYSIDDLAQVVDANLQSRQEEIHQARQIIAENAHDFMEWLQIKDLGPLFGQMRDKFQEMSQKELACFFAGNQDLTAEQKQQVQKLIYRQVNRQIHLLFETLGELAKKTDTRDITRLLQGIIDTHEQQEDRDGQRSL